MGFLKWLEGIRNPFFDFIFSTITMLGEETVFMAVAIFVFWCVNKKDGYYILSVGFIGTIINQFLKLSFRIPRPWVKDPSFTIVESARAEATGYSFPSGHTQSSVGTFASLTWLSKKNRMKGIFIALCVLVPFSRLYLGVHTPLDVFTSVGIALLLVLILKPIFDMTEEKPRVMYVLLGVMLALALSFLLFVELFKFPDDIDPHNYASGLKNSYTLFGALIGMIISYPIEKKFINFDVSGKWYTQLIKVGVGLALALGVKAGLKPVLNLIFNGHNIANAIRYALVVVFAVIVWPLIFPLLKKLEDKIESKRKKYSQKG
jgi:undecaprenyl-diphosphatase